MTDRVSASIRAIHGTRFPGGCDTCDAFQEIRADNWGPGVHSVVVHHDDWCPTYKRIGRQRSERM